MINSHITAAVAADRHRTLVAQARADDLAGQARSARQRTSGGSSKLPWGMLGRLRAALSRTQLQPLASTDPNAAAAEPSIVAWSLSRGFGLTTLTASLANEADERADAVQAEISGLCAAPC